MAQPNPDLDFYFDKTGPWQDIHRRLRAMALELDVTEEKKWWQPCYAVDGKNTFIISAFKDFATVNFFKGIIMDDPNGLLVKQGENGHAGRVVKLSSMDDLDANVDAIAALMAEAVRVERAAIPLPPAPEREMPDELAEALDGDPELAEAFHALTPGRQRSWFLHVSGAKQVQTRFNRIEKARPAIIAGKGLNER